MNFPWIFIPSAGLFSQLNVLVSETVWAPPGQISLSNRFAEALGLELVWPNGLNPASLSEVEQRPSSRVPWPGFLQELVSLLVSTKRSARNDLQMCYALKRV